MINRRRFLKSAAAAGIVAGMDVPLCPAAPEDKTPLPVGNEPQLFLDDWIIDRMDGLKRVLHQPEKKGLIKNADGSDWDRGDCYAYDGYIVCRDSAGRFHMTYRYLWWDPDVRRHASVGDDKAHWFRQAVAYATSDDGIHWRKPKLGLLDGPTGFRKQEAFPFEVPAGMSKDNNLGCPFDFINDLSALGSIVDPKRRFLLRLARKDDTNPFAKVVESQLCFAADWPDFVNDPKWKEKLTPIPGGKLSPRGQKSPIGYDHEAREWFHVCQDNMHNWLKHGGREIARFWSPDLVTWNGPKLVLPVAKDESREPADWVEYMAMSAHRLGGIRSGVWLGQLEIFHSDRTDPQYEVPMPNCWRKGVTDQRLMLSRDAGKTWQRVGGKQTWLPYHRDEHGYDRLVFNAVPVRVGDEVWFYYSAWDGDHLGFKKDGSLYEPGFLRKGRTARATLRWNGFISLDAGESGGELLTRPFTFAGSELTVNLQSPRGELRVELQSADGKPLPGFGLVDSVPIRGDGLSLPVRWQGNPNLAAVAGKPVRVRCNLKNGSIYSFQFMVG